jgi:hypothetical protein
MAGCCDDVVLAAMRAVVATEDDNDGWDLPVGELANSTREKVRRRVHSPTCVSKSALKRVHWKSE